MSGKPTAKQIRAAVDGLKPKDMTAGGLPKVTAVSKALGTLVTREAIDKALTSKSETPPRKSGQRSASKKKPSNVKSAQSSKKSASKSPRKTSSTSPAKSTAPSTGTGGKRKSASDPDTSTSSTSNARAREEEPDTPDLEPATGRGHRNAPPLTVETVVAALQAASGVRAQAAKRLGVTRSAVTHFISRHPEVEDAIEEINETLLDLSEGKLLLALNAGDGWAIRYFLEQHGARRGYGKKVTVKGDPDNPVHHKQVGPDYAQLLREGKITKDELKQMRDIQRKIEADRDES